MRRGPPDPPPPSVEDLRPDEALGVLRKLVRTPGAIGEAARREVHASLVGVDPEAVASEVRLELDLLDVEDLWERSGRKSHGYAEPTEAASPMIEEALQPYVGRMRSLPAWGLDREAREYGVAVLAGIDRFDGESESNFVRHAPDSAADAFDWICAEWQDGAPDRAAVEAFQRTVTERFGAAR